MMKSILSPCIGVCELDEQQVCVGCSRTIEEIGQWTQMDDRQRKLIMDRIDEQEKTSDSTPWVVPIQHRSGGPEPLDDPIFQQRV